MTTLRAAILLLFLLTSAVGEQVPAPQPTDGLYVFPPVLEACREVIGSSFKLSSLLGRTLRPHQPGHRLHVACGDAGSLIVFHASTWHGHTANTTSGPRRSIQGFFVPRGGRAGTDYACMSLETRTRLSPLAHHLLTV
jgi:hypothetical protein